MQTVLYQFLIEVPEAAAIWSALLLLALLLLAVLVARPERDTPTDDEPAVDPAADRAAHLADLRRYADEVAVAAAGAAQNARRHRQRWLAAQEEMDRAWRTYETRNRLYDPARSRRSTIRYRLMTVYARKSTNPGPAFSSPVAYQSSTCPFTLPMSMSSRFPPSPIAR